MKLWPSGTQSIRKETKVSLKSLVHNSPNLCGHAARARDLRGTGEYPPITFVCTWANTLKSKHDL